MMTHKVYTDGKGFSYDYDARGRLTKRTWARGIDTTYTYNAWGNLVATAYSDNTPTVALTYDRMGRRVTKNNQRFIYNGYLQICNFHSTTTTSDYNYFVWDPTEPVATRPLAWNFSTSQPSTSQLLFYTHDGNKNVSEVIASDDTLAAHYEYAPFGALTVSRGESAAANSFRFSSEYAEDETATVYYNYRHYEPVMGRWMARDPILSSFDKLTERDKLVFDYLFVENAVIIGIDVVGLELKMSGCECEDKIKDAVDLANHWLQQPKCKKWFEDHGYNSDDHTVACHGGGKPPCWFFPAWTMPFGRLGVCVNKLENNGKEEIANIIIHEMAHHYCPMLWGREDCAMSAQDACWGD